MKDRKAEIAILVSIVSLVLTVYYEHWKGASLGVAVGEVLLVNQKPRIGALVSIHNAGANTGAIVRGTLKWDSQELYLRMISPKLSSWRYTLDATMEADSDTTFTFVQPILVPPKESVSLVLWFTRDLGGRFITGGDHELQLEFYDGTDPSPVATSKFWLTIERRDLDAIYADENEAIEIPIHIAYSRTSP